MKKLIALSLIACMAVSTAACGSSSKDTAAAETTDAAEETTDTAEETADAADTEASDKTWVIAMDTVFRPFEYTDEKGEFVGIDVDIIKAVAANQGFNIEIQSLGWDAAVTAVQVARQTRCWQARASQRSVRIADGFSLIPIMILIRYLQ